MSKHQPVLLTETIRILNPQPHEFFIDGTINGGGHAREILKHIGSQGFLLGVDLDEEAIANLRRTMSTQKNLILVNDNYKNMANILKKQKLKKADGILLDLGFSSDQLSERGRGFSFAVDEPLVMTYNDSSLPVSRILEKISEKELAEKIREFGGERLAGRVARAIKSNLPIRTTGKLVEIIKRVLSPFYERGRLHPATRTFQALRIWANRELDNLTDFLREAPLFMNPGGRLAIISFHSLEDGLVKKYFNGWAKNGQAELLNRKPIIPSRAEIGKNPRSRSAKLRALRFL